MSDPTYCNLLDGFLYGALGGFFAELRVLFKIRHDKSPKWLKSCFYWIITVLMVLAGGALVTIYVKSNFSLRPIIALNIGASAPLIFETFISMTPPFEPGKVD